MTQVKHRRAPEKAMKNTLELDALSRQKAENVRHQV